MCGAEPLVSMNSAESVDAFYALLDKRKHLEISRSVTATPKWPASRNDHYCDQQVCRHDVLDLSSLCEPSDGDSDVQSQTMPEDECSDPWSTRNSESGSYIPDDSCFVDEYAAGNVRFNRVSWNKRDTHPRSKQSTPLTSYDDQDPHSSQAFPKNPIPQTSDLRRELDNLQTHCAESFLELDSSTHALRQDLNSLQTSSAKSHLALEERFITLSELYATLRAGYEGLAEKHDALLRIALKLCDALSDQAEALQELKEWKKRTQNSFSEVRVQGQDAEVLYYATPRSPATIDIATEEPEPTLLLAENKAGTSTMHERDSGVVGILTPPSTPATTPGQRVARPRLSLKLKLPSKPDDEEGVVESAGTVVSDRPRSSKRVRKPTGKRKAAELQAESTGREVKKSRT